jgi:hypothetical protein
LGAQVDPNYSPAFETILSMAPFLFVTGIVPFFIRRTNSASRFWSRQYHLHRPFTADIDESSIRISEPLATNTYTWAYFRGHTQSPNLFLLYPSSLMVVMIPKRAFPTPEARQQFVDFLARTIVAPTTAFPVLPALPLPALPAMSTHSPSEPVVNDSR